MPSIFSRLFGGKTNITVRMTVEVPNDLVAALNRLADALGADTGPKDMSAEEIFTAIKRGEEGPFATSDPLARAKVSRMMMNEQFGEEFNPFGGNFSPGFDFEDDEGLNPLMDRLRDILSRAMADNGDGPENNWGFPLPEKVLDDYEWGNWDDPRSYPAMTALAVKMGELDQVPQEVQDEELESARALIAEYDEGQRVCGCPLPMCPRTLAFQVVEYWKTEIDPNRTQEVETVDDTVAIL